MKISWNNTHLQQIYFLLSLYNTSTSHWVFLPSLQNWNKTQLKASCRTAETPEDRLLWKLEGAVKQMCFSSQVIQTLPLKGIAGENQCLHRWWMHHRRQSLLHRRLKWKWSLSWPCLTMPSAPAVTEESNISEIQLLWAEDSVSHGCCCRICLPRSEQRSGFIQVYCHRF